MNGYQKSAAKGAVWALWKNFGDRPVRIDPRGKYQQPLKNAEKLGWCKWSGDRCALTTAGVQLANEYVLAGEAAD